ncbi:MAG TPA: four helix bundle protein [Saprospiraceae bacterium]|nr:four helix bundle protein [Saprospiraceae bacterium]
MEKTKISSYKDLDVYQRAYKACLIVMQQVVPKLPPEEKYDMKSQLSRSSKAVPRLIGEGYAKKHQKKGFQKYLDDAMSESNETEVGMMQCKDLYFTQIDPSLSQTLANEYNIIGRQIFKLREAWSKFTDTR